ncbi:MAG: AMP-binding protein [Actinomycetota bacterium]|nr:AMP-binding protein [Actinomycetota bacterium]
MTQPAPTGISDLLRRSAARRPSDTALVDATTRISWLDLDRAVSAAATALLAAGASAGDRVTIQLGTSSDFVLCYLGALRAGLIAVPVNPAYAGAEVDHIRVDSGAGLHLDPIRARELAAAAAAAGASEVRDPRADRVGEQVAVLLYTSGTSGRPKGAMLSARALLANLEQLAAVDPPMLTGDDVLYVPLPLSHVFGLNAGLGMALKVGATLVIADRFDAGQTLEVMAREAVTAVLGVPGQFAQWIRHPEVERGFADVRFAMSGSTTLAKAVLDGFADRGVVLHDGYGLTEAAPVVSVNAIGDRRRSRPGSIGLPLPGVQVELRDEEGEVVDPGDPGRIFVRGENLFSGYWPDGADGPDAQGWFGTGDLAVTDGLGELHLVGRTAELVIVNGFNVYPAEVEAVLASQPGVAEVAVAGAADEQTGETVVAFVVPVAGVRLDVDALLAAATGHLARFKLPTRISVVDALPRTVTGKIMKWQLDGGGADDGSC